MKYSREGLDLTEQFRKLLRRTIKIFRLYKTLYKNSKTESKAIENVKHFYKNFKTTLKNNKNTETLRNVLGGPSDSSEGSYSLFSFHIV